MNAYRLIGFRLFIAWLLLLMGVTAFCSTAHSSTEFQTSHAHHSSSHNTICFAACQVGFSSTSVLPSINLGPILLLISFVLLVLRQPVLGLSFSASRPPRAPPA